MVNDGWSFEICGDGYSSYVGLDQDQKSPEVARWTSHQRKVSWFLDCSSRAVVNWSVTDSQRCMMADIDSGWLLYG